MAKVREREDTKHMTRAALVCRSQGHSLEGLDTALPAKLRGASAIVTLRCMRYNPGDPRNPFMCGYGAEVEISLATGGLISRVARYTDKSYLRLPEDRGLGRLPRDDARQSLIARLVS